jgi:hypothetical protein
MEYLTVPYVVTQFVPLVLTSATVYLPFTQLRMADERHLRLISALLEPNLSSRPSERE